MNLKKAVVRLLAAVSAVALPLALTAAPASAEIRYHDYFREEVTFPGPSGEDVTCILEGEIFLDSESDTGPFATQVRMASLGGDPACEPPTPWPVYLFITVRFEDPDGDGSFETSRTSAWTEHLVWEGTTGRDVTVNYYAQYRECSGTGTSLCDFEFTRRPK